MRRICPRCESADVRRLPENGIAPHPGYECKECGLAMRPNGHGLVFGFILVMALGMCGVTGYMWFAPEKEGAVDGQFPIGLPIAAAGVALYCFYQLLRPAPLLVKEDGDDI